MGHSADKAMKVPGAAGVLGVALAAIGSILAQIFEFPGTGSSAAEITAFVDEHRSALLAGMILNTLGVSLWLVFGAGLWAWLRQMTGGEGFLSSCFAFGFVGFVTLLLAGFTSFFVLAYRAPEAENARLLYDLAFGLIAMSGPLTAVALGAYAALVFPTTVLPRWTAWLATLAAVAHVVLLSSFVVETGFFSLEGQVITAIPATLFAWIAGTGLAMLAGRSRAPG